MSLTDFEPGNPHARHTDPLTSKVAGLHSFTTLKHKCCLLIAVFDSDTGLTSSGLERVCQRADIQRLLSPRPLGKCSWHRITDCVNEGWVAVLTYDDGQKVTRLETDGMQQQVFRITEPGRVMARQVGAALGHR